MIQRRNKGVPGDAEPCSKPGVFDKGVGSPTIGSNPIVSDQISPDSGRSRFSINGALGGRPASRGYCQGPRVLGQWLLSQVHCRQMNVGECALRRALGLVSMSGGRENSRQSRAKSHWRALYEEVEIQKEQPHGPRSRHGRGDPQAGG